MRTTTFWKPLVVAVSSVAMVLGVLYIAYRWVDPLPPRHLTIAAGPVESGYDHFARMLARDGVELEVRNSTGAVEDLKLLRDAGSGVQAALTTFGVTEPSDADIFYSLGGIFDSPIFIFYRNAEPITQYAQLRGKRLSIGKPGTALRSLVLQVLKAIDVFGSYINLLDLDNADAIDALIASKIDLAIVTSELDGRLLQKRTSQP